MAQMALMLVLCVERVTSALIGASRVEQIEENVAMLDQKGIFLNELEQIAEILIG